MRNVTRMLSKSITRLEKIIHGTKHSNRDMWWFVIRQAKYENTQQLNVTQTITELRWYVVSYDIIDPIEKNRTCGIMKITVKEKVNLSFDITANASTIQFFIDIQWTVGEAKHTTDRCQARINSQKVEGTMFCNMVLSVVACCYSAKLRAPTWDCSDVRRLKLVPGRNADITYNLMRRNCFCQRNKTWFCYNFTLLSLIYFALSISMC